MKYDKYELSDLFLLARQGDGTAFEQIVLRTEKQVYNLALSITRSHEDAQDITQDTYLKLWQKLSQTENISSAKYYILMIARNTAIDLMRKYSKDLEAETLRYTENGEFEPEISDSDPLSRPDVAYFEKVKAQTVRECIAQLPMPLREIITLRDLNGLSYSEISKMLSMPEGTVKSSIFRAREQLRLLIIKKNIL